MLDRPRRWLRQLAHNRSAIRRDIGLGLSHASSLPFALFPLNHEPTIKSELDPRSYNSTGDILNSLSQLLIPAQRDSVSQGTLVVRPPRIAKGSTAHAGSLSMALPLRRRWRC